jgi:predicted dehydrogenase
MKIAIVGCGYVAEQYMATLAHHPALKLAGAFDRDAPRLEAFTRKVATRAYPSLEALLGDAAVELVVNLTNPRSHFVVNRACLEAGKHVYSEKPLAMTTSEARCLADLADRQRLQLGSAPCSILSGAAQTLWRAVREGVVGTVRVVYATFDDGMIAPHQAPWTWTTAAGVPWPAKDEFEVGSTYQHAGYVITWLCAMFGPARRVTSFASVQMPDKGIAVDVMAPDFTVGCIEFDGGVVARVTCGLSAPRDKSIIVVGDKGTLMVGNVRDDGAPVMWGPPTPGRLESIVRRRLRPVHRWLLSRLGDAGVRALFARRYRQIRPAAARFATPDKPVDFLRGPSEMADAITTGRRSRLSADFGAHLVELVERLQHPERFTDRTVVTTFDPIEPMPWAR